MTNAAFLKIEQLLPFLLSSFSSLFIAAQIALIIFCRYLLKRDIKLVLRDIKYFFLAKSFLFGCVLLFGVLMWQAKDILIYDPMKEAIIATKIAICLLIVVNIFYMYYKFLCAKRAFAKNEPIEISENIVLIAYYFTPLNIILSLLNIFLGIALRDF